MQGWVEMSSCFGSCVLNYHLSNLWYKINRIISEILININSNFQYVTNLSWVFLWHISGWIHWFHQLQQDYFYRLHAILHSTLSSQSLSIVARNGSVMLCKCKCLTVNVSCLVLALLRNLQQRPQGLLYHSW